MEAGWRHLAAAVRSAAHKEVFILLTNFVLTQDLGGVEFICTFASPLTPTQYLHAGILRIVLPQLVHIAKAESRELTVYPVMATWSS